MIAIETSSGSRYEIDQSRRRIRRVSGKGEPTARTGKDLEWREYESTTTPELGRSLVVIWPRSTTPLLEGSDPNATPATITSPIVRIEVFT